MDSKRSLMGLPPEIISRILGSLSFDDISSTRGVCKELENCAKSLLSNGFQRAERFHARLQLQVKSQLPRRESERRNHQLARHSDILTAVETRLSLLNMTFSKYMEMNLCCFIPGKVVDELFRVLREVSSCLTAQTPPERPHELLQELRDISSMAMEHFDERIAPRLRAQTPSLPFVSYLPGPSEASTSTAPRLTIGQLSLCSRQHIGNELGRLRAKVRTQNTQMSVYKKELSGMKATQERHQKKLQEQGRLMAEQNRKLEEFGKKYDGMLSQLGVPQVPDITPKQKRKLPAWEAAAMSPAKSPRLTGSESYGMKLRSGKQKNSG